jgi:hypothetical protein
MMGSFSESSGASKFGDYPEAKGVQFQIVGRTEVIGC